MGDAKGEGELRVYPAPWKGQLLLACGKCQKKLRRAGERTEVAKIKKAMKARAKLEGGRLRVIEVSCLKLCPKGGVAVCTQGQMAEGSCSIVWTGKDLNALYQIVAAKG